VPLLLPLHAVAGPAATSCSHAPGGIPAGSSCTPAACTTTNLGPAGATATCSNGALLWKGGCACGAGQHDASNSSLPDTGVCADNLDSQCFAELQKLCSSAQRTSKAECLACCSKEAPALQQAGCAQHDFTEFCPAHAD
jgi:hypothetical protein